MAGGGLPELGFCMAQPIGQRSCYAFVTRRDGVAYDRVTLPAYPSTHEALGEAVREARRAAGLTLGEAARRLGLGVAEMSYLERGHAACDLDAVGRLFAATSPGP